MNKMKININEHLTFDELYMLAESAEDPFGFDDFGQFFFGDGFGQDRDRSYNGS